MKTLNLEEHQAAIQAKLDAMTPEQREKLFPKHPTYINGWSFPLAG
jgi:hypothetical protein